jgi:hypothetical protein
MAVRLAMDGASAFSSVFWLSYFLVVVQAHTRGSINFDKPRKKKKKERVHCPMPPSPT